MWILITNALPGNGELYWSDLKDYNFFLISRRSEIFVNYVARIRNVRETYN